ncbi:unnamed protein product, partial [Closterium sp. Naga37s-1]
QQLPADVPSSPHVQQQQQQQAPMQPEGLHTPSTGYGDDGAPTDYMQPLDPEAFPEMEPQVPEPGYEGLDEYSDADEEAGQGVDLISREEFDAAQAEARELRRRLMEAENENRRLSHGVANHTSEDAPDEASNPGNSSGDADAHGMGAAGPGAAAAGSGAAAAGSGAAAAGSGAAAAGSGAAAAGPSAPTPNGVAGNTLQASFPRTLLVEPNRVAIINAVRTAHSRGTILDLQQLSSMQRTWAHRYADALASMPDIHNGFKGAASRAVEILYFETSDVDLEYWTPRDTNITALCTALNITDPEGVANLRLVMENETARPRHLRKKLQDARNKTLTTGRVLLYERFDIRIKRPDRNRVEIGTLSPAAFCASYPASALSWDLLTWHHNRLGIPFASDFFTLAIFHSFERPGHAVLVLRFKQIAFFLLG